MTYFFDSYAIIELLEGSQSYQPYQNFKIITSVLNVGEVYAIFLRNYDKKRADEWFKDCNFELLEIYSADIVNATYFRHINKKKNVSITDSVGYILSLKHSIKFLTGDKQFQELENVEFVK